LETGAALLNDEGGEDLVVMFERSVRDVHSNLGTDLAVGEGAGIGVGGVYREWKIVINKFCSGIKRRLTMVLKLVLGCMEGAGLWTSESCRTSGVEVLLGGELWFESNEWLNFSRTG
jgi:hypothetical protein